MIERQMELASLEKRIKVLITTLLRLDNKLPFVAALYMLFILGISSIPMDTAAHGQFLMAITPLIRSILHIPEYGLLFLLCAFSLHSFKVNMQLSAIIAIPFSLAFAAFEEFYQSFIPGRFMSPADWDFDAAGILLGYAVMRYYSFMIFSGKWE